MTNSTDPTLINNLAQATPVRVPACESNGSTVVSGGAPSRDDVVDVLNDLLEKARDGECGFKTCANQIETARAKEIFAARAEGCRVAGEDLIVLSR